MYVHVSACLIQTKDDQRGEKRKSEDQSKPNEEEEEEEPADEVRWSQTDQWQSSLLSE